MEALLKDSLRMMRLAQEYEPSYRTINCFLVHEDIKDLLRQCFVQFRCQLVEAKQIDNEAIFIDGTKIEANANKFTFVWKKSIIRYQTNLIEKSQAVYDELLARAIIPAIQRKYPKVMWKTWIDLALHKQKYAKAMTIFGTRNSYTKTDHDATFMRMKKDYMRKWTIKSRV